MTVSTDSVLGIVGGTGWLGGAIAQRLLRQGFVMPSRLWLSNRSGSRLGFEAWPDVAVTSDNAALAAACDVIVLAVRPEDFPSVAVDASEHLVISVMASVPVGRIAELTGATRIVRTMPNPAVEHGEGFTPWFPSPGTTEEDRAFVRALFDVCGPTEQVSDEDQINYFTGLTGPVPGFFGYVAHALIEAAVAHGIERGLAERAVRHHAVAAGREIVRSDQSPAEVFDLTVGYGGTTSAGFKTADAAGGRTAIAAGLKAAWEVACKDRSQG